MTVKKISHNSQYGYQKTPNVYTGFESSEKLAKSSYTKIYNITANSCCCFKKNLLNERNESKKRKNGF
jgi:hypothetical protein